MHYYVIWPVCSLVSSTRRLLRRFTIAFQQGPGKVIDALQNIQNYRNAKVQCRHDKALRKAEQLIPKAALRRSLLGQLKGFDRAHDEELRLAMQRLVMLKEQVAHLALGRRCGRWIEDLALVKDLI